MEEIKTEIQKEIPKKPRILGFYDEEEERWIKAPSEKILTMIGMQIKEITQFVRSTIREMKRLNKTFDTEKVSFDLNIQGNRIRFTVVLKEKT